MLLARVFVQSPDLPARCLLEVGLQSHVSNWTNDALQAMRKPPHAIPPVWEVLPAECLAAASSGSADERRKVVRHYRNQWVRPALAARDNDAYFACCNSRQ